MMLASSASVAKTEPKDVIVVVFSNTLKWFSDLSKLGSWSLKSNTVIVKVANWSKKTALKIVVKINSKNKAHFTFIVALVNFGIRIINDYFQLDSVVLSPIESLYISWWRISDYYTPATCWFVWPIQMHFKRTGLKKKKSFPNTFETFQNDLNEKFQWKIHLETKKIEWNLLLRFDQFNSYAIFDEFSSIPVNQKLQLGIWITIRSHQVRDHHEPFLLHLTDLGTTRVILIIIVIDGLIQLMINTLYV